MPTGWLVMTVVAVGMLEMLTTVGRAAEEPVKRVMSRILRDSKVEAGPWSRRMLGELGKDSPVPDGVRSLVQNLPVEHAGGLWYAFSYQDGRPGWYWEFPSMLVNDPDRERVMKSLSARFRELGFSEAKLPPKGDNLTDYTQAWRRLNRGREMEDFVLIGIGPAGLGGTRRSLVSLWWTIRSTTASPMPTYAEVVRALPVSVHGHTNTAVHYHG